MSLRWITTQERDSRCPYCVVEEKFRLMKTLTNGRLICEACGHIIFPDDRAFKCPCQKCVEMSSLGKRHKWRKLFQ